jgi:hypothetical protein
VHGQTHGIVKTLTDILLDQLLTSEHARVKGLDYRGEVRSEEVNWEAWCCHYCQWYEECLTRARQMTGLASALHFIVLLHSFVWYTYMFFLCLLHVAAYCVKTSLALSDPVSPDRSRDFA